MPNDRKIENETDEDSIAPDCLMERIEKALPSKSKFDAMTAFGVAHLEHPHSTFLAYLLDPNEDHGFGSSILREFLSRVRCPTVNGAPSNACLDRVTVQRERLLGGEPKEDSGVIDILIHIEGLSATIGVEAKVWAGEEHRQIERYQKGIRALAEGESGVSMVVFVTPDGRPSVTKIECPETACVEISWSCIADCINKAKLQLTSVSSELPALLTDSFVAHLKALSRASDPDYRELRNLLAQGPIVKCLSRIRAGSYSVSDQRLYREFEEIRPRLFDVEGRVRLGIQDWLNERFGPNHRYSVRLETYSDKEMKFYLIDAPNTSSRWVVVLHHWYNYGWEPEIHVLDASRTDYPVVSGNRQDSHLTDELRYESDLTVLPWKFAPGQLAIKSRRYDPERGLIVPDESFGDGWVTKAMLLIKKALEAIPLQGD